jgi:hypothetical protein
MKKIDNCWKEQGAESKQTYPSACENTGLNDYLFTYRDMSSKMNCTGKRHHKYQIVTGVLSSCWSAGVQKRKNQVPCSSNKQPANQRMSEMDMGEEQGH